MEAVNRADESAATKCKLAEVVDGKRPEAVPGVARCTMPVLAAIHLAICEALAARCFSWDLVTRSVAAFRASHLSPGASHARLASGLVSHGALGLRGRHKAHGLVQAMERLHQDLQAMAWMACMDATGLMGCRKPCSARIRICKPWCGWLAWTPLGSWAVVSHAALASGFASHGVPGWYGSTSCLMAYPKRYDACLTPCA